MIKFVALLKRKPEITLEEFIELYERGGGYWIALLMRGAVARHLPDGTLGRLIPLPVLQPTKVCFGGPDLATLFVTSAGHRHIPGEQPLGEQAGGLFLIDAGVSGIPEPRFAF